MWPFHIPRPILIKRLPLVGSYDMRRYEYHQLGLLYRLGRVGEEEVTDQRDVPEDGNLR